MTRAIAITGGGTGGHVYPALAICREVQKRGYRPIYIGHPHKPEAALARERGLEFYGLVPDHSAFRPARMAVSWPLFRSVYGCLRVLRRERVHCVVAMGGFVSVPAFVAAQMLRVPCAVHEQNVRPGRSNRLFLRFRPLFLTTFRSTAVYAAASSAVVHTGCPVDDTIGRIRSSDARKALDVPVDHRVILVLGGSGGAPELNDAVLNLIPLLEQRPDVAVIHVTGTNFHEEVRQARAVPYANPIAPYYACADVIVSRAGSASINECVAARRPCILVPSPHVTEHHQEVNARRAGDIGVAHVLREAELSGDRLAREIEAVLQQPDGFVANARIRDELGEPAAAAAAIADAIEGYLCSGKRRMLHRKASVESRGAAHD